MRIRELRISKKWTLSYVAECLNVSSQTVGNWETSKTEPDLRCLIALADLFEVSIDYLIGRDNDNWPAIDLKLYIDHLDDDKIKEILYQQMDALEKKKSS